MESLGYITLQEAARRSGKTVEALKKQCQDGRLRGAIKQGSVWFVPQSEIVISPGQENDGALRLALTMTEATAKADVSGGFAATLYVHGVIVTGTLIPRAEYLKRYREQLRSAFKVAGEPEGEVNDETEQLINKGLDAYFEAVFNVNERQDQPIQFVHLKDVSVMAGTNIVPQQNALLRIKLASVDGFTFGRMEQTKAP